MLSSFQPDPVEKAGRSGQEPNAESAASEAPATEASGLGEILQQILDSAGSEHRNSAADRRYRAELIEVADRLRQYDFCFDPVLLSMVCVITGRLKHLTDSQHVQLQRSVANSLYEDIASRERLERLWQHLVRLASDAE